MIIFFYSLNIIFSYLFLKVDMSGKVLCQLCNDIISYASRGYKTIEAHCVTKKHSQMIFLKKTNQALPGTSGQTAGRSSATYGLDPGLVQKGVVREEVLKPPVPLCDRITNAEVSGIHIFFYLKILHEYIIELVINSFQNNIN